MTLTYYDADGNVTKTITGAVVSEGIVIAGSTMLNYYDPDGQLIETVDPNGGKTYYGYDDSGNRISLTGKEKVSGPNRVRHSLCCGWQRWLIVAATTVAGRLAVVKSSGECAICSTTRSVKCGGLLV